MAIETSYSQARAQLASLLDSVVDDQEIVIVNRRGKQGVAMIAAAELQSLVETVHLLRSPKNARRLLEALHQAQSNRGEPSSLDQLRCDVGLTEEA
ncbi:type II toxin-antitoxin system Phd/YefM family antitoxin [Botrimarina sp.]|uniref:type II toxin-antitoxin system Phd/YefM family antitoxin n=1 Tax=Botrimarina sp. TaxID=2795802 RepID=UPI0032ED8D8D